MLTTKSVFSVTFQDTYFLIPFFMNINCFENINAKINNIYALLKHRYVQQIICTYTAYIMIGLWLTLYLTMFVLVLHGLYQLMKVNGRAAFRTVLLPEDNGRLHDFSGRDKVESAGEFNRPLSSGNRTVRKDASPLTLFIHISKDLKRKK